MCGRALLNGWVISDELLDNPVDRELVGAMLFEKVVHAISNGLAFSTPFNTWS